MKLPLILKYLFRLYPVHSMVLSACLFLAGLVEGVGFLMFLPILESFMPGARSTVSTFLLKGFTFFHLPATLTSMVIFVVACVSLRGVFLWLTMRQVGYITAQVATDLRLGLMKAVLEAKWSYFVHQPVGQFSSAVGVETKLASRAFQSAAVVVAQCMEAVIYAAIAFMMSWQTAALALVAGALLVVITSRFRSLSRKSGRTHIALLRSLSSKLTDAITGVKAIKAMAREHLFMGLLTEQANQLNRTLRQKVIADETVKALQEPLTVVFLCTGMLIALKVTTTPIPTLMVLAAIFMRLLAKFNAMLRTYTTLINEEAAYFSVHKTTGDAIAEREVFAEVRPSAPVRLRESLTLDGVTFSYRDRKVLDRVSLRIPAGKFIAVIGASGSGKSTLADIIAGLHTPQSGDVLVDGVPLSQIDLRQWRSRIGYVPQEIFLFHDTLRNNITLGDALHSDSAIEQALKDADAWGFVGELPEGLNTIVGERGARLSGGQRQRIALARALVQTPDLLILDEITASLDPATEAEICRVLQTLNGRTTILAISHQPLFTKMADTVLRVSDGCVTEEAGPVRAR